MTKRIIGLVLALCLIVGLLPMIALAEETEKTASLTILTGTADNKKSWKPTLSEGMAAAYAKNDADGFVTASTEADWTIKMEWATGGIPTLTLKNAKMVNERRQSSERTIVISGNTAWDILLEGTNEIYGNPTTDSADTGAGWKGGESLRATNSGMLTIKGRSKADKLTIDNQVGNCINRAYGPMTIENATITLEMRAMYYSYAAIYMAYGTNAENAGVTDLTVRNVDFTAKGYRYNGLGIIMGSNPDSTGYDSTNVGDILFQNSKVDMQRTGSSGYQTASKTGYIRTGTGAKFEFDRCDVYLKGSAYVTRYVPTLTNCTTTLDKEAGSEITATFTTISATHVCGSATDDFDCTTANTCDMCGESLGAAQTAHTPEADDGDCTTAIKCANAGCNVITTAAAAAHTPEADDGDCTTAIKCSVCGKETTPGAATHTSPADRTSCDQPANCTVCNKALAVGEHTGGTATCKDKAKCATCGQEYGELGEHTGGTATCKDKAVCTVCNQAYGELSTTHVPAEDDKDCTTAVKCTVCGGEAIAAQTHKYTNGLDTTCDNEGCEHTRVVEPKPIFSLSFGTTDSGEGVTSTTGKATVQMNAGDPTKYYTTYVPTAEAHSKNSILKATTDTTNWCMKIEYDADGIPTVTLKNAVIDGKYGLLFGGWNAANEGPVKLVLEGTNIIAAEYSYKSALQFLFKGDKGGVTIEGPGSLLVSTNCHGGTDSKMGAVNVMKGSLTMNNANLTVLTSEEWGNSFGIVVDGGDFNINGGSLKVVGYDNASTTHYEGKDSGYNLNANALYAGIVVFKTDENATNGNFTVAGGAKVTVAASIAKNSNNPNHETVMAQGKFTIKDSEVEIAMIGKCVDGAKLFSVKPTLEFANGYTVTATKTKKASPTLVAYDRDAYTKDISALTPDESKLVDWAETTSMGSITYFKVVAGGSGSGTGSGTGTGTGSGTGSNPNTGDISILLTAGIALASAVGFGGVTMLRKKEN